MPDHGLDLVVEGEKFNSGHIVSINKIGCNRLEYYINAKFAEVDQCCVVR